MIIGKRDITALVVLLLSAIVCVKYFYKDMNNARNMAKTNPYSLILPTAQTVFNVERPSVFKKMILPMKHIQATIEEHVPPVFLSIVNECADLSSFMVAFYPEGCVLYASIDARIAQHIFKKLDESYTFPPLIQMEEDISVRYYPDINRRFLGCYYHNGIFVASFRKNLLTDTAEKQQSCPSHIIAGLKELTSKKSKKEAIQLFMPGDSLNLYVQINDTLQWRIQDQWLDMDLFYNDGSLFCFHEHPYRSTLDSLYPSMRDTITTRLRQLLPAIETSTLVSHDDTSAYFTIRWR